MVILTEGEKKSLEPSNDVPAGGVSSFVDWQEYDPPPTYVSSPAQPVSPIQVRELETSPSQACNFVSFVRKNTSVKGSFVIDPSMYIPSSLRPPLAEGETEESRKNLRLESHNGSVDADILLIGEKDTECEVVKEKTRTTLNLRSENGWINAKVRTSSTGRCNPFHLTATSKNGSVVIHLPRSFQGFMTLMTTNGTITFSDQLSQHVTTFSHVSSTKRCFVGDLTNWVDRDEEWKGDEVIAGSHNGRVKLQFSDEVRSVKAKGKFLSRLLWF